MTLWDIGLMYSVTRAVPKNHLRHVLAIFDVDSAPMSRKLETMVLMIIMMMMMMTMVVMILGR